MLPTDLNPELVSRIRSRLLDFYDRHRRDLPWRRTSEPYRIWVSEVMLQQTRVETVVPYYLAWIARFPSLEALAEADVDEVLAQWRGLGYYVRARNLHRAARIVRERFAGQLPADPKELRSLPGVGDYTAGAVGSIAFNQVVPVVDGNVRRVLSRLLDLADPSATELARMAATLVDPLRPGDFNQALMELGATVCTPQNPSCPACPLGRDCLALSRGTIPLRPYRRARGPIPVHTVAVAVVHESRLGHFLVRRRPDRGLLAGMWEFPGTDLHEDGVPGAEEVLKCVPPNLLENGPISAPAEMPEIRHAFTHLRILYRPFLFVLRGSGGAGGRASTGWRWASPAELLKMALPRAQQRIFEDALTISAHWNRDGAAGAG